MATDNPIQSCMCSAEERAPPRIRVMIVVPNLRSGGAERVVSLLCQKLTQGLFEIVLVVIDDSDAVYLNDMPAGVEIITRKITKLRSSLWFLARAITGRRPQIVLSTVTHLNLWVGLLRPFLPKKCRFIARESNVLEFFFSAVRPKALWKALYRYAYRNFDMIICQSNHMSLEVQRFTSIPSAKMRVINNPVDIDHINKVISEASRRRLDSTSTTLVAIGRLTSVKGFDNLIEALAIVNQQSITLKIVGDGPLRGELEALAQRLHVSRQISFLGYRKDPYVELSRADAMIISSRYESFPNIVLEALVCGTPVIATPAGGGISEILDKVKGCVVSNEVSATSLASAIMRWMASDRRRIDPSVSEPYGLKRIIPEYERAFLSFSSGIDRHQPEICR
jgi:glycosyltransferase involved in cell wall biosynthesis